MSEVKSKHHQVVDYIKDRWWLAIIVIVLLTLFILPSKTGLPGDNYQGCTIKGSYCTKGVIKGTTKESDGSTIITVAVNDENQNKGEISFHLKKYNGSYAAGNEIFMNFVDDPKEVVLFVERDSRLLWSILSTIFGGTPASTAVVDRETLNQIR